MPQNIAPQEPYRLSPVTFFFKIAAGIGAGVAGTLVLLMLFLLTSSILQPVLNPTGDTTVNPLFVFVLMAMMFLTSLAANMLGPLFFSFIQREKYTRLNSALTQIFVMNVLVLLLTAPMYIITNTMSPGLTGFVSAIHLITGALASMIIFEVVSNPYYALVGVYGAIFAILISTGANFIIYEFTLENATILMFAAIPVMWTMIGFVSGVFEALYRWIYATWGHDFLATEATFGADYGVPETAEAEMKVEAPKDEAGADFLRGNK